jgi:hypothetical protein
MALCTQLVTSGGSELVALQSGVDPTNCAGPVLLSSSEYANFLAASMAFDFDASMFSQAFLASLFIVSIGLGAGQIISLIRRVR